MIEGSQISLFLMFYSKYETAKTKRKIDNKPKITMQI